MKKKTIIIALTILILTISAIFLMSSSDNNKNASAPMVSVKRSTITDKVLAVGTIEPLREIQVKSKVSGIVAKIYNDAGTYVKKGDPLMEIKPDPTPTELVEATRNVSMELANFENIAKEKARQEEMMKKGYISNKDYEDVQKTYETAKLRLDSAKDKLSLLKQGRVSIQDVEFTSVIRAEIDGFVLQKMVNIGDPVVPSTSFQAGMVLMTLADMNTLIFKGTVDEINVGRLSIGMPVELKVGALPNQIVNGKLSKISLKAQKKDNATSFDVEIEILPKQEIALRAGFSANADIIINKKEHVLTLPERVISFVNDSSFVWIAKGGDREKLVVKTGLSDAINIEIIEGVDDSTKVFEPALKSIQ